jgi:probable O-glycosylation ligase (exosortase A-associated)
MFRTVFVIAILLYGAVQSLRGAFYGLLFYLWLAYFRPEYWLWWDFVSPLNLSLIVGIFVLASTLLSAERIPLRTGVVLMLVFLGQSLLSTLLSDSFDYSFGFWQDFAKSTVISILIVSLVNSEKRLRLTLVVISVALGMEAAKQGWAQLLVNPGGQNLNDHPVLGDNNGVAVGMFMLVSILVAVARTAERHRESLLHRFLAIGVLYRAIATYSRGGFLACGALGLHHVLRSKRKVLSGVTIVLVAVAISQVLPQKFWDRMGTIDDATENTDDSDASIQGRLHFWHVGLAMAEDRPLLGVGHNAYNVHYNAYDFSLGKYGLNRSVHSSWVGVLAEVGYPAFVVYVLLIAHTFWVCSRARRMAKKYSELSNLAVYATGLEGALTAFLVGGTFVIFQYNEMLWHTLALSLAVDNLVRERLAVLTRQVEPAVAAA